MVLGIYGAGGLGREVLELAKIINSTKEIWEDFVFIVDVEAPPVVNDIAVYQYEEAKDRYGRNLSVVVGIGEPAVRERIFSKLEQDEIILPSLVHPDVHIPESTSIGKGVVIQDGCFISCNAIIEDYVYVNAHAIIGHDDVLKRGCVISGFANLAGTVKVGSFSYVGMSACVIEKTAIGDYTIIGMASVVYKDIPDEAVAMGNPARPIKRNKERRVFT